MRDRAGEVFCRNFLLGEGLVRPSWRLPLPQLLVTSQEISTTLASVRVTFSFLIPQTSAAQAVAERAIVVPAMPINCFRGKDCIFFSNRGNFRWPFYFPRNFVRLTSDDLTR